ncbi:chorismate mutase [Actinomadura flavalba]|uniref:chorismate mutase n=1 Tax=Actinomadura flavalba TaxID=1120938 RepID=UPI000363CAC6|nr:chorismate mutase [Actinomadura flavalba]
MTDPARTLDVRLPDPASLDAVADARTAIDDIDRVLATLLEHRAAVAGRIQDLKPVGGFAGRNPAREAEIVAAMAPHAPTLGPDRLARIMSTIIECGLELAEHR